MKQQNIPRNTRKIITDKRPTISLRYEPRDLWIGVYWDRPIWGLVIYICILPMLPIRIHWYYEDEIPF